MCDTTGLERRNRKRNLQPTNVENGDAADAAKKTTKKIKKETDGETTENANNDGQ